MHFSNDNNLISICSDSHSHPRVSATRTPSSGSREDSNDGRTGGDGNVGASVGEGSMAMDVRGEHHNRTDGNHGGNTSNDGCIVDPRTDINSFANSGGTLKAKPTTNIDTAAIDTSMNGRSVVAQPRHDVMRRVAASLHHIPAASVTDTQREQAKHIVYGLMYGLSIHSLSNQLQLPLPETQSFMNRYVNIVVNQYTHPRVNIHTHCNAYIYSYAYTLPFLCVFVSSWGDSYEIRNRALC